MRNTKDMIKIRSDIIEWDIGNWGRAIDFWETDMPDNIEKKKVLDIGGRRGGISLFWALKGARVVCSDLDANSLKEAKKLHKKYGVSKLVEYEVVDVTDMSFEEEYDIITFKSVMGGVGYNDRYDRQELMIKNIYNALKPGGVLYFAENLTASSIHKLARKRFMRWGDSWRYVSLQEMKDLTREFDSFQYLTVGMMGVFGRNKWLSRILSFFDFVFDRFCPENSRYIISGICKK